MYHIFKNIQVCSIQLKYMFRYTKLIEMTAISRLFFFRGYFIVVGLWGSKIISNQVSDTFEHFSMAFFLTSAESCAGRKGCLK